jgi:hypothetical protein
MKNSMSVGCVSADTTENREGILTGPLLAIGNIANDISKRIHILDDIDLKNTRTYP